MAVFGSTYRNNSQHMLVGGQQILHVILYHVTFFFGHSSSSVPGSYQGRSCTHIIEYLVAVLRRGGLLAFASDMPEKNVQCPPTSSFQPFVYLGAPLLSPAVLLHDNMALGSYRYFAALVCVQESERQQIV